MSLFGKSYHKCTDEALMGFVVKGKSRAFETLYDRYETKLFGYFYRMLGRDKEKAQDFLQELFLKVAEHPDRFDTTRKFSTYLYTLAANLCKNEYRRMAIRGPVTPISAQHEEKIGLSDLTGEVDQTLFMEQLQTELDKLEVIQRETFTLRFQEGLSIKEISRIMDCSEGTVKSRIHYTTRKLAALLHWFGPEKKKVNRYEQRTG